MRQVVEEPHVSLRSGQEETIMASKRAVAIYRQADIVMLESPACDSKANGAVGRAALSLAGPSQNHQTPRREEVEDINTEGFGNDDVVGIMGCRCDFQIQSPLDWTDKP